MRPMSPVVAGFDKHEIIIAEDQPEYQPLPALILQDGRVICRWHLTWWERLRLLWSGSLYLHALTFGAPLQPQLLSVDQPELSHGTRLPMPSKLKASAEGL